MDLEGLETKTVRRIVCIADFNFYVTAHGTDGGDWICWAPGQVETAPHGQGRSADDAIRDYETKMGKYMSVFAGGPNVC